MEPVRKTALLIFCLGASGVAQLSRGQCGGAPVLASAPVRGGIAAKPASSKTASVLLPQVRIPRAGLPPMLCWCGTVIATSLIGASASQEVPAVTGLGGNFRLDHVQIAEARQVTSDLVTRVSVSAGLPNSGGDVLPDMPLKVSDGSQNFSYDQPAPPAISGTYSLVLKFTGSSPLGSGILSNLTGGTVDWEVCGYQVR